MWIVSQYGFFSVVKDHKEDVYKIRSRVKHDLLNLFPEERIITTYDSDYRHRAIVTKHELDKFLAKCSEIEYTNFKGHISNLPQQRDKVPFYTRIWEIMYKYQKDQNE